MRRTALAATLAAGLLAIPAAASAHPAFNPSRIPTGEAVPSMLVVPHGCAPGGGMPDMSEEGGGDTEPTVELALQHTEGVTVEPGEVDGWEITDDGEAWVWSDDGGATTDVLEFPVTLTIDESSAAGDELHLKAYQECADGSAFQWIGTPDEEASFPAILLTASDGEMPPAPDDAMTMDMGEDMTMAADAGEDVADAKVALGEAAAPDNAGLSAELVVLVALILLAGVVSTVLVRRRGRSS